MLLRFTGILFVLVFASPLRAQDSRQVLIMWEDPAPIFADTALGPSQLNATAPTPGTFLYDPPAGTLLSLGYQRLCVTFVPDDTVAFDSTQKCIPLSVGIRTAADTPVLEPLISIDEYIEAAAVESSAGLIYSSGPPLEARDLAGHLIDTVAIGGASGGGGLAIDSGAQRIYLTSGSDLWVVNAATRQVLERLALPSEVSTDVAVNPSTGRVYVGGWGGVYVFTPSVPLGDAQRLVVLALNGGQTGRIAVNPTTNLVYVALAVGDHGIEVLDGDPSRPTYNTVVAGFGERTDFPGLIAIDRHASRAYVPGVLDGWPPTTGRIFVVDIDPGSPRANSVIDIIDSIPLFPGADTFPFIDVVVNSNNGQIYALLVDGWQTQWRTLTTIDGASDTATSTVMAGLSAATNGLLLNPSSSDIYVTNTGLPDGPGVLMRFRHAVAPRLATPADPQREVVVVAAQASVTFAAVTAAGETVVTPIDPAEQSLTLPGQFSIANALAYDVSTTANVRPPIQLCFNASSVTDRAQFAALAVLHGENGAWVDRTISRDSTIGRICARVDSLSPFVIARRTGPVDTAPPTTTASTSSLTAWNSGPVTVTLTAADEPSGSGVASLSYFLAGAESGSSTVTDAMASVVIAAEGVTTITFLAADRTGNQELPQTIVVRIDRTPPTVDCHAADTAWHATDVTVGCRAIDNGSGLAVGNDASFTLSTFVPYGVEMDTAQTTLRTVCDAVGNCVQAGPVNGIKVDKRPPVITLSSPMASATYALHQVVPANYGCQDDGAGAISCTGTVANGAPIATGTLGPRSFEVESVDGVGHRSTATASYTVAFGISSLYDQFRAVRSGSTIPIKVRLVDASGVSVSSPATTLSALGVTLTSYESSTDLQDAGNANPDANFRYEASSGDYIFNLKTTGLGTGTYRLEFQASGDPTIHAVQFQVR